MTDVKDVLDWANSVCEQALTEAKTGNTALVNRIGANSAMKLFFDNVHGLKTVQATQFAAYYAPQFKEITRLYEEYILDEEVHQTVDKVAVLESKLDKLTELVMRFVENQQEQPAADAPTKDEQDETPEPKKGKKPAKDEAEAVNPDGDATPEPEA
ncbi:MAG TPA: hypothetical protein VK003_09605 [Oceanobacillus sp.]|nr:hypothetical protein [Oceanobacillus sp.]